MSTERLNLKLSRQSSDILSEMANNDDCSKSEIIRRALTLMLVAKQHEKKNHRTAFIDSQGKVVSEVIGL